jgi:hypothetical protein
MGFNENKVNAFAYTPFPFTGAAKICPSLEVGKPTTANR